MTPSPSGNLAREPPPLGREEFGRAPKLPVPEHGEIDVESTKLRDFSRTVAEINWLLVILVLLYYVFKGSDEDNTFAVYLGTIAFSAAAIACRYLGVMRRPRRWLLAIETWLMIIFVTWVLYHTGRLDSPLLNLYLLPIVTSALTLGQKVTLLQVGLIAASYMFLGYSMDASFFSIITAGNFAAYLAPMLLVAYITTMLSHDILTAMGRFKLISETDELTGVYNLRAFHSIAEREFALAARHNRIFSMLMIDSDNLKKVNDTHGHEAGDRLIRHVVQCIKTELRTTDLVARYGGDEFICLLPETGAAAAARVAERIRCRIADAPLALEKTNVATSVSVGVTACPDHGVNFGTLVKNADHALYVSKSQGRNRVTIFSPN